MGTRVLTSEPTVKKKSQAWYYMCVIAELGSLTGQPSLLEEPQDSERPCVKKTDGIEERNPR